MEPDMFVRTRQSVLTEVEAINCAPADEEKSEGRT